MGPLNFLKRGITSKSYKIAASEKKHKENMEDGNMYITLIKKESLTPEEKVTLNDLHKKPYIKHNLKVLDNIFGGKSRKRGNRKLRKTLKH